MLRVIGDLHGNFHAYNDIIDCDHPTLQLGDMGIGFPGDDNFNPGDTDFWIHGNHDNYNKCLKTPNFIKSPDLFMKKVFLLGGGWSIDWAWRRPGVSWWANEELPSETLDQAVELYKQIKPPIVVSHEAPSSLAYHMADNVFPPSRTARALQAMYDAHKPKIWFYGHWHLNFRKVIGKTQFICVPIDSYVDIDLDTLKVSNTFTVSGLK